MLININKLAVVGYMTMMHLYAAVGIVFVIVFVAIQLKLTNVSGSVDPMSEVYQKQTLNVLAAVDEPDKQATNSATLSELNQQIEVLQAKRTNRIAILCELKELGRLAGVNVKSILENTTAKADDKTLKNMMLVVRNHVVDQGSLDNSVDICKHDFEKKSFEWNDVGTSLSDTNLLTWMSKPQWQTIKTAILKDKDLIFKAASIAQIKPRLLVSNLVVEQMRLFYSQRELYQKFFEPLKILANANKTSLGVMSIKEETAIAIEAHLINSQSPYYLGEEYHSILAYPNSANSATQRYTRLTNEDHYYNYLYGALYLKQFLTQWQKAGFTIEDRPEIVGTLFNVGFAQSKPNPNPKVGGSSLTIEGVTYSFGRFAHEFYYSGELEQEFPL